MSTTWKTKDGQILNIVDMEDDHIINVINFIRSRVEDIKWKFISQELEIMAMVDMHDRDIEASAFLDMDSTLDNMNTDSFLSDNTPIFKNLLAEANKRGLNYESKETVETR